MNDLRGDQMNGQLSRVQTEFGSYSPSVGLYCNKTSMVFYLKPEGFVVGGCQGVAMLLLI